MMDRDRRAEAAAALREYADTINRAAESGPAEDVDAANNLREMADELVAEPADYDYACAAAERGTVIEAVIAAHDVMVDKYGASGSSAAREALANRIAEAKIIMEGVDHTHRLVPVTALTTIREFVVFLRRFAGALTDRSNNRADELERALDATVRGEGATWPS